MMPPSRRDWGRLFFIWTGTAISEAARFGADGDWLMLVITLVVTLTLFCIGMCLSETDDEWRKKP